MDQMLKLRPDTIKLLEVNVGKVFDIGLGMIPKHKRQKQKSTRDYIKLKSFCTAKETINKMKR